MSSLKRTTSLLCVLALAGCSTNLTQDWQLVDFRILGLQAVPAQPARGASTQVTLAYADTMMRPVQVVWLQCAMPVSLNNGLDAGSTAGGLLGGFGGSSGCALVSVPGAPLIPDLGTTVTVQVPPAGGAVDTTGAEVVNIVGYACAGGQIGLPMDGGSMPSCTASDGGATHGQEFIGAVFVQSPGSVNAPNNNPQISEVDFGMEGGPASAITVDSPPTVQVCASATTSSPAMRSSCPQWVFTLQFTPGSRESYLGVASPDAGPSMQTERLTTGYIVDNGTLSGNLRMDSDAVPMSNMPDTYTAPATSGTANVYIYVIDGRGGFDWTMRTVVVQ